MHDITRALLASISAIGLCSGAFAQKAPETSSVASSIDADEIVVTAQRREQSLSDVGMSITAIGGKALEARNITSVNDLAKLVPGFAVSESRNGTPLYTLRGVGVNEFSAGSASSVAIYVDEVPLSYAAFTQGAAFDLQRLEVLKGPQGTLYGQNSTGGAINYIANKPTDQFAAGISGSFGRFNTGTAEAYVSGPIGSTLRGRIALQTVQSGPWQKSFTRDDAIGRNNRFAGRAILEWAPSSDLKLTFNMNGWTDNSDNLVPQLIGKQYAVPARAQPQIINAPLAPATARLTDWDPGIALDRDNHFYQGSVRVDWNLTSALTLTSISAYSRYKRDSVADLDGIATAIAPRNNDVSKIEAFSQEVRLAAEFSGIRWIAGSNIARDQADDRVNNYILHSSNVQNVGGFATNGAAAVVDQRIRSWAVFTNVDIPFTDQLSLTAGIRLSQETRRAHGCSRDFGDGIVARAFTSLINGQRAAAGLSPIPPILPGACVSTNPGPVPGEFMRTLKEDNVPWNVNLNWKPTDDILLYGRISKGFKSGNFATLTGANNGVYTPVTQEELLAYEAGARVSLSRAFRFEAAIFQYDYKDKQVRARVNLGPPFGLVSAQDNIPRSRIKGAEASLLVRPAEGLSLNLSGVYLDSRILEYTGFNSAGVLLNQSGARLSFAPKYSANADLSYTHALTDTLKGFLGANLAYRGKTVAALASPPIYDIASYTLLDAQMGVESDKWKAWIFGKNITNKYYWTNVNQNGDVIVRFPAMPVTYGLAFSYKY